MHTSKGSPFSNENAITQPANPITAPTTGQSRVLKKVNQNDDNLLDVQLKQVDLVLNL
jgi:hypothetical protein